MEEAAAAVDPPMKKVAAVEPPVVVPQIAAVESAPVEAPAVDPPAPSPNSVVIPAPASSTEPTTATSPHLSAVKTEVSKTQCLVLNAGSSSLKYAVLDVVGEKEAFQVVSGLVERIGAAQGTLKHEPEGAEALTLKRPFPDHRAALEQVIELLTNAETGQVRDTADIKVVGHRVVHGGESFTAAALIDHAAMAAIRAAASLAPLHAPANITGIEVAQSLFPCPQVAVFDTAFHMTMPPAAYRYAVPKALYSEHGIRRYGFHGSSYTYVRGAAATFLGLAESQVNLIVCHLGNGASMAAIKAGVCVDTTMGLTPLEGLVMGTRSGDVDPALHLHLEKELGMNSTDINTMLNKKSGLVGLCGDSDMRAIQQRSAAGDADATLALDVFVKRVRKYLGSFLVELGGKVDAVVFTGGIGENSAVVRSLVCANLEALGISLDEHRNAERLPGIRAVHSAASLTKVLVVPTNEELSITLQSVQVAAVAPPPAARPARRTVIDSAPGGTSPGVGVWGQLAQSSAFMANVSSAVSKFRAAKKPDSVTNSLYVVSLSGRGTALLELGLFSRLFQQDPMGTGYFRPIGNRPDGMDTHVDLIVDTFGLQDDKKAMTAVDYATAVDMLATGHEDELIDMIVAAYEEYRRGKKFVLLSGVELPVQSIELNFSFASFVRAPVLFQLRFYDAPNPDRAVQQVMLYKRMLEDMDTPVELAGVVINRVEPAQMDSFSTAVRASLSAEGVPLAAVLGMHPELARFRINEILSHPMLSASVLCGAELDRFEASGCVVAAGTCEQCLCECRQSSDPAVVVVDAQRTDVALAMLFAAQSVESNIAAVVLTGAASLAPAVQQLVCAMPAAAQTTPVLLVTQPLMQVALLLTSLVPTVLPSSKRKIDFVMKLFDDSLEEQFLTTMVNRKVDVVMTPKLFQYRIYTKARASKRTVVLPEGNDKRVVAAAAELAERALCTVIIMGVEADVYALAAQQKVKLTGIQVIDPRTSPMTHKYASMLFEARKAKGMTEEKALSLVTEDANYFGTMMMYAGDADGMVSGACHTTADTMRPALQIIKTAPGINLVSSIFFMLLPEQVYVYGDCAINVDPNAEQLADIAVSSALTARAFGIEPRVALLSYATGESNSGDLITKVRDATASARAMVAGHAKPFPIEGPLQFDAAVDPKVAEVKVKTASEVAGKANVCVFPDLNAGNNAYKAVQQASDCIAMGPIMQGLKKPVNDLSRGCTVADIVNTVVITCIQSMG